MCGGLVRIEVSMCLLVEGGPSVIFVVLGRGSKGGKGKG